MQIDFSKFYDCVNGAYHDMITNQCRWQIIYGGSGSGKSYSIAQDEIYKQLFFPGTNLLVVRQTSKSNRSSTFPLFKQVISSFGLSGLFAINKSDMTITCLVNGNEIRFVGLDDVEKIKSVTFDSGPLTRIWVEEASETKEDDIDQLNLRLRGQSSVPFQIRLSFNPISSLHWLKKRFFDFEQNADGEDPSIYILHTTYKDNEWIDEEYKKTLESLQSTNKIFYDVYCLGKWGVFGNVVFDNWKAMACPYKEEDFDELFCGMDFGYNHPLAMEKLGMKDGALYSYDEIYVREKTNAEAIDLAKSSKFISTTCTADSAEPARIKEWKQHGLKVVPAKKGKDSVARGVDYLKSLVWYIDPVKCPGLLAEVQTFSYKEDKNGNVTDDTVNFKDDGIAGVRYAMENKSLTGGAKSFHFV